MQILSKTFARKDTAKTHERTHASVKDAYLHCKHCGKGFAQSGNHKRHEPHCKKLPFICTVCPYKKRFQLKQSLLRHIRFDHIGEDKDRALESLGETPFTCEKCNKNFASERGLKQHETDIKKPCDATRRLHCDYCAKQFKTVKYRKIHERIHTGENSHTCKYCKKVFSQRSNLTVHVKKHHPHKVKEFLMETKPDVVQHKESDETSSEIDEKSEVDEKSPKAKIAKKSDKKSEVGEKSPKAKIAKKSDEKSDVDEKSGKVEKSPKAKISEKSSKCRFCFLGVHDKLGGMACEHLITCDFTTKYFHTYKQHMLLEHKQEVECELNPGPDNELGVQDPMIEKWDVLLKD